MLAEFCANPANQLLILFLVIAAGLLLGRVEYRGVSLGSSGVLFVALLAGHLGATLPGFVSQVGVVLFVYAVGLMAGPRFFKTFRRNGASFGMLALVTLAAALLTAIILEYVFRFGSGLMTGLYTGALTTTPGLASAMEAVDDPTGDWARRVSVGYGIAYPLGVAGVVVFIQVFPRLLRLDLRALARQEGERGKATEPAGYWFQLANPQLVGMTLGAFGDKHIAEAVISRVERADGTVLVGESSVVFASGDKVRVICRPHEAEVMETVIGPRLERKGPPKPSEGPVQSRDVFITEDRFDGKSLRQLQVTETYGVVLARLWREEMEFVPQGNTRLALGDLVRIVGTPENCERFIRAAGNADRKLQQTNFLPLCAGLVLGVLLGRQNFAIPGTDFSFSLGLAGGPLFVALIAGHYGRIGTLSIRMPVASKIFVRELGLLFFLAAAGVVAGAGFWEIIRTQGLGLLLAGAALTVVPMVAAWIVARRVLRLDVLASLGAICGGMTSTPALGALTAAADSESPALAYASTYPVALITVTIFSQLLGRILYSLTGAM
jgi:putative transport protein